MAKQRAALNDDVLELVTGGNFDMNQDENGKGNIRFFEYDKNGNMSNFGQWYSFEESTAVLIKIGEYNRQGFSDQEILDKLLNDDKLIKLAN